MSNAADTRLRHSGTELQSLAYPDRSNCYFESMSIED